MRIDEWVPRWRPLGSHPEWHTRPPEGIIIALHRKPWRVVECREIAYANWTPAEQDAYLEWPTDGPPEEWSHRPWVMVLDPLPPGKRRHGRVPGGQVGTHRWDVLPEHYPVCNLCQELMPCTHITTEQEIAAGQAQLDRLTSLGTGSCWRCSEVISPRQKSVAYDGDNLLLPGGPSPVRFHVRSRCHGEAAAYEKDWLAADPSRQSQLYPPAAPVPTLFETTTQEEDR